MEISAGSRVDRYVLEALLGEGGQGSVWRVRDLLADGEIRALKLVTVSATRPADLERVRREARKLAQLEHPSLVTSHGMFEDLRLGVLGVVMDFVDGPALAQVLTDPDFSAAHRVALLSHVAEVLAFVHSRGIVHRDLKPENVLLTGAFLEHPEDPHNVKVVDFGIAHTEGEEGLTQADHVVGTASYLAPELLLPGFFGSNAPRSAGDLFAYGVMAHLLLTGQHPTGLPRGTPILEYALEYRRAAEQATPWPAVVPEGPWGTLIRDCLAVRCESRIPDGAILVDRMAIARQFLPRMVLAPPVPGATGQEKHRALLGMAKTVESSEPQIPRLPVSGAPIYASSAEPGPTVREPGSPSPGTPSPGTPSPGTPSPEARRATFSSQAPLSPPALNQSVPPPATIPRKGPSILTLGFGLVGLSALLIAWTFSSELGLLLGSSSGPKRFAESPPPSAHFGETAQTSGLATQQRVEALHDGGNDSGLDAGAGLSLPAECQADASLCSCCPTLRDCSPGTCSDLLAPEERFALRLRDLGQKGQSVWKRYPRFQVCIGKGGTNPGPNSKGPDVACTKVSDLDSAYDSAPATALLVSGADLADPGLDVRLYEPKNPVPIADSLKKKLIGLSRLTLCRGLSVELAEGDGRVDRVELSMDPPDGEVPERCP